MLNFIVTNHWWQKYQNREKNHEYRRKTNYWDVRVRNALIEHFGEEKGLFYFKNLHTPKSKNEISVVGFPKAFPLICLYRRAYTADHEMPEIYSICTKNGLDTDLKIDDWVYDFEIKESTGLPF